MDGDDRMARDGAGADMTSPNDRVLRPEPRSQAFKASVDHLHSAVLTFWRTRKAQSIEGPSLISLHNATACYSGSGSIRDRAAAAIAEALEFRTAVEIDVLFDTAMTELLVCALEDAGAALVLSHMLRWAPIDRGEGAKLAASWLAYNLERAARTAGRCLRRNGEGQR